VELSFINHSLKKSGFEVAFIEKRCTFLSNLALIIFWDPFLLRDE
jgi:hypothetical protein